MFQSSLEVSLKEIEDNKNEALNQCNIDAKHLKDLKREFERLQMSLREKLHQEADYQQKLERGNFPKGNMWQKPDDTDF